ncbi:uridine kinase [Listeria monocytogenes]|nr:uridine kinase [Listeria monocytogenes]
MGDSNTKGEKKINHTQKGKIDFNFFMFMLLTFNNSKNIMGFLCCKQQRINSSVIQHTNFKGA